MTALTMEVTNARKPMELKEFCAGRHCLPPFSGMKIKGASLVLRGNIFSQTLLLFY